jgi:hypothetical protein
MGCCCAKETDVESIEDPEDPEVSDSRDDDITVPASGSSAPVSQPKPKSKKKSASAKRKEVAAKKADAKLAAAAPPTPAGAVPIVKGERPPPGWGGTPEVEEIELELEEDRRKGPRALKNVNGKNGYISGTRKDQEISEGVMDRIGALEDAGLRTKKKMGMKMLTPRIITDVKEVWDEEGNATRYMTHYIEEPDGTKHTKKEQLYIAAGDPDPMATAE